MNTVSFKRSGVVLHSNHARVLLRPFLLPNDPRARMICAQVMALSECDAHALWEQVQSKFGERHAKIRQFLRLRFEQARHCLAHGDEPTEERVLLLGAYFSHEYSLEAAALFNPSIVPHPDQSNLPAGSLRFILSLRATGEGHISSITFRTGIVDSQCAIAIDSPTRYCLEPAQIQSESFEKSLFDRKLRELGLIGTFTRQTLQHLGETFTLGELKSAIGKASAQMKAHDRQSEAVARKTLILAQSNYEVQFPADSQISERVLFPVTPSQSNGIEDARFVLFHEDDGSTTYYATYTAYDGKMILPQFIETRDFSRFKFITLNGPAVRNKGMALFPRKINGRYVMLGRQDKENISIMFSDHLHFWDSSQTLLKPKFPWEFIQLGNCGSPIETPEGWLVISHGVGAMREYSIGAFLLDRDDPTRVIGRLRDPLIRPDENEREGYVPNVVYSCGSLLNGDKLILPYAMSDYATTFAEVALKDLLAAME
jgi:predicted GH43/DUF377 family glycosyl hydrolase